MAKGKTNPNLDAWRTVMDSIGLGSGLGYNKNTHLERMQSKVLMFFAHKLGRRIVKNRKSSLRARDRHERPKENEGVFARRLQTRQDDDDDGEVETSLSRYDDEGFDSTPFQVGSEEMEVPDLPVGRGDECWISALEHLLPDGSRRREWSEVVVSDAMMQTKVNVVLNVPEVAGLEGDSDAKLKVIRQIKRVGNDHFKLMKDCYLSPPSIDGWKDLLSNLTKGGLELAEFVTPLKGLSDMIRTSREERHLQTQTTFSCPKVGASLLVSIEEQKKAA